MSTPANELPLGGTNSGVVDLEADFLSSFGMGTQSGAEPPLSTDDLAGDKGAGAEKSDTGKKDTTEAAEENAETGKGKQAGADTEGEGEDEDLEASIEDEDDEVERAIKATPKEHQAALRRISKTAKFEDHVRNGTKSPKQTVEYIKGISPARYNEIAAEVIKDRLTNVASFVEQDLDDDTYSKIASEILKRDPDWVAKRITGSKTAKLADIVEAYDAKASGAKDSVVALPEIDDATMEELASDYEEVADFLKAVKLARGGKLPRAFTSQLETANAEIERLKTELEGKGGKGKTGDRATKAAEAGEGADDSPEVHADTPQIRKAVELDVGDYVERQALDAEGMGLKVSDEEREAAPEVAELKETMLNEWLFGSTSKKTPSFMNGLMTHFKENEKFMTQAKQVAYFANRGEQENALLEVKKIRKFVDAYRKVRAELPTFKRQAELIAREAKQAGREVTRVEKHIPGGGSQTPSPASRKGEQTDDDIVNGFNLG